ncbi:ABC-type transporter, integral membrane subunit [Rhizobium sp. CF080]|uniref:ABC transporter permease n=1 Tax=Rhizobium sp. (strain CF080) TaxID=1144310 RepID=UPI0003E7E53A|nr:ABC transporter permease [Rhizobium sp. CF080]EUB99174.1 ABC-type transporter, integral membrane subunit [Rhizobium sp. CF080]
MNKNTTRTGKILWLLASLAFAAALIAGWQLIANMRLISPVFLPGPDRAFDAAVTGFESGELGGKLLLTVERMIYGWVLSSILGVALGTLIGSSALARSYFGPTLEFIRPLPASAIAPIAITLFGLSNASVLVLIAFGTIWPMLLATIHGFAAIHPRLTEVGHVLKLSRLETIWKIALPNAVPDILASMRLGLTISLILTIVGEMLMGLEGIGNSILLAARSFDAPNLYAGVILIGLIGLVSNLLLDMMDRRLLRWRPSR